MLSGLLRRYLRELPEPLVPTTHFKPFMNVLTSHKKFKNGKDRGGVEALKSLVDHSDFSRVHYHALFRVCSLFRTMLVSWWSDQAQSGQILDIVALSILRPDNLSRSTTPKELTAIKEAAMNLITFSSSIFVAPTDTAARRQSMMRRGERASLKQLVEDDTLAPDTARTRRFGSISESSRYDLELRAEFKAFREMANLKIANLTATVEYLQMQIDAIKDATGVKFDLSPPPTPNPSNGGVSPTSSTQTEAKTTSTQAEAPANRTKDEEEKITNETSSPGRSPKSKHSNSGKVVITSAVKTDPDAASDSEPQAEPTDATPSKHKKKNKSEASEEPSKSAAPAAEEAQATTSATTASTPDPASPAHSNPADSILAQQTKSGSGSKLTDSPSKPSKKHAKHIENSEDGSQSVEDSGASREEKKSKRKK